MHFEYAQRLSARFGRARGTRLLFVAVLLACGSDLTGPKPETTFLSFTSDAGDYIGDGHSRRYGVNDGDWFVEYGGDRLSIDFSEGFPGDDWHLQIAAPIGRKLRTGGYLVTTRFPQETRSALQFYGNGRGCNTVTGEFYIKYLEIGPANTVERLHLTFEQHCEGGEPALRGEIALVTNPWR
jgi:hypothetical protein